MRLPRVPAVALLLAALLTTTLAASASAAHLSATIYGLTTGNRLLTFSASMPGEVIGNQKISGLQASEALIGIDVRPLTGQLYGVGRAGTNANVYRIDPASGNATYVTTLRVAGTTTPVVLSGTEFGVDFNPAADALRIVSDFGQNLRALPSDRIVAGVQRFTGDTLIDGPLNYGGVTASGITGAAYTNSDVDPLTGTTLFDIDAALDQLVRQDPPNAGTLTRVGGLGVDTGALVGFDVRTVGSDNYAYAALTSQRGQGATLANLYLVDLSTGAVSDLGKIGGPKTLRDIAVAP
jgi:hypothetical protein